MSRLALLYQYILAVAAEQEDWRDRKLREIHLLKYAYAGDLAHAAHHGEGWTGVSWRFYHFGPWDEDAWQGISPAVEQFGGRIEEVESRYSDGVKVHWVPDPPAQRHWTGKVPLLVRSEIKKRMREFGSRTEPLLAWIYATKPMRCASPGARLDLSVMRAAESAPADQKTTSRLTPKQRKKRKARFNALRERGRQLVAEDRERVKERQARMASATRVEFGEHHYAGMQWLESLAGGPFPDEPVEVVVDESVWQSPLRKDEESG